MGDRRRGLRPAVKAIESRTLLSVAIGPLDSIQLSGTLHGQFRTRTTDPDVGTSFQIKGTGPVEGFGHTSVTGEMQSLTSIAPDAARADLALKQAGGTITLHLESLVQRAGLPGLPDVFDYGITDGTGRYEDIHAFGSATLTLLGQGSAAGQPGVRGRFTLVLTPEALPL